MGDAKANKGRDSSGNVADRIARPSGWINRQVDYGTESLGNHLTQITQLDGSNEGILYDRAGQALQMPPDVDGDWSQYYRLVWDAWGRLVQVKDGNLATVATYAYDGTTRRITKTVGGTTIHTYYNDRWKAIEEREDSSTDASRQYLWGARPNHRDELVRSDRDTTGGGTLDERLYCLMDYYDPIAMVDASGNVVERYEFSAFGLRSVMNAIWVPLADTTHAVDFAFHGQFLDTETGYYNYGYRYYSPQIGRWLSKDPIEKGGGVNVYEFSGNNGLRSVDFLGLIFDAGGGVQGVPLTEVTNSAHGWLGSTGSESPDKKFYTPDRDGKTKTKIVKENGECCVELESVESFVVKIKSVIANDQVGKLWTQGGFEAAKGHEQRRVEVYEKAYNAYLKAFDEGEAIQTMCRPCRSNESTAKATASRLENWVKKQQEKAQKLYLDYILYQQRSITGENSSIIKDGKPPLITGISQIHNVTEPPEIRWDKCPN